MPSMRLGVGWIAFVLMLVAEFDWKDQSRLVRHYEY